MEQLFPLILALVGAGGLAGVLAGLFGIGGGIVIVPALFQVFLHLGYSPDIAMHVAAGTSLAAILPTAFSSTSAHARKGGVDKGLLKRLFISTSIGSVMGAALAPVLGGRVLTVFFALFACFVAYQMARGAKGFRIANSIPDDKRRHLIGGTIGFVSSLLGIGGGTISVPTFVAAGYSMPIAVGTGSALGIFIAAPGALGMMLAGAATPDLPPYSLGYVNGLALLIIAPLSAVLAPLGAKLSHSLPEMWLKRSFAILLALIAVRMVVKAL